MKKFSKFRKFKRRIEIGMLVEIKTTWSTEVGYVTCKKCKGRFCIKGDNTSGYGCNNAYILNEYNFAFGETFHSVNCKKILIL